MQFDIESVIKRLESFGYILKPNDEYALGFVLEKIKLDILNFCNIQELPDELIYVAIDMVCGEFLLEKKSTGNINLNDIDLNSVAIKSISEGDTSVSYATENTQDALQKLDGLIQSLLDNKKYLYKFRRLAW
jgi:hypothetical protein